MVENLRIKSSLGLGIFKLHSKFSEIFTDLQEFSDIFGTGDLVLDNNLSSPIYIVLKNEDIKLRFNGLTQRLELIQIGFKEQLARKTTLWLNKNNLNNILEENLLNYQFICNVMGPTFSPTILNQDKNCLLKYKGISFIFDLNTSTKTDVTNISIENSSKLAQIYIYSDTELSTSLYSQKLYFPFLVIFPGIGFDIYFKEKKKRVEIGNHMEKILDQLKNPQKIYENVGSPADAKNNNQKRELILNYFEYGIDVVIDGNTNICTKFIIYTNMTNHPLFRDYDRCLFIIQLDDLCINITDKNIPEESKEIFSGEEQKVEEEAKTQEIAQISNIKPKIKEGEREYRVEINELKKKIVGNQYINCTTTWTEIQNKMGDVEIDIFYTRNWTRHLTQTQYFPCRGIIFEIIDLKTLASLTIFKP